METVKINQLEIENVKRIRAVQISPSASGLTVIGGNNNQGKTSVLDTLAWALGGDRYRPSNVARDGSNVPPMVKVKLSNGLIVERSGKNSSLKVTDPNGKRSGQQLLNSFIEELALNLPRFLESSSKEKADTLLQIIGVGDQLRQLEYQETDIYNRRRTIGQIADQKKKFAKEMPFYGDAPKEPISAFELIQRQQAILAKNGENQRKRLLASQMELKVNALQERVDSLTQQMQEASAQYEAAMKDLEIARKSAEDLQDESTEQIEKDLQNIEAVNIKVRANCDREKAEQDSQQYIQQYDDLTAELERTRQAKIDLLSGASLPLPGLSVEDGELTYKGKKWDGMSGSDQLKVATAIVRSLNPQCGFVLVDKLEQMDMETLQEFGTWLESQNLQVIATRVSTGEECSILIEDGYSVLNNTHTAAPVTPAPAAATWKAGEF